MEGYSTKLFARSKVMGLPGTASKVGGKATRLGFLRSISSIEGRFWLLWPLWLTKGPLEAAGEVVVLGWVLSRKPEALTHDL